MAHWSKTKEKAGSLGQMRVIFYIYKKIGFKGMLFFLHPITFFFFLFSRSTRKISKDFLQRVLKSNGSENQIRSSDIYNHIYSFSFTLIEKLAAWAGDTHSKKLILKTSDIDLLKDQLSRGEGAIIISSHLGNIEMLRAFANQEKGKNLPDFGINPIVDFSITSKFNELLEEVNPNSMVNLINASSIDASTIIQLQDKLNIGEIVSIAGDRTAKGNQSKSTKIPFLGEDAYFPQGTFILASLLDAPVYFMFAVRENDKDFLSPYEFHVYKSNYDLKATRKERSKKIQQVTEEFVSYLESLCKLHPLQWFNFFDFWAVPQINQVKRERKNG